MTRDRSFLYRALFLVLGCICYRLLSATHPDLLPNISPMIAVALVGAMYLPRAWGWLIGPAAFVITEAALLTVNYRTEGHMFSSWTAVPLFFYALVGGLGIALARNKSLLKIVAGSILCSVTFYVLTNTLAWWGNSLPTVTPSYAPNWAGWWQANTMGLPGWQPSWTFLRNSMLSDLAFTVALVLAFEPGLVLHPLRSRPRVSSSSAV
jgi:hypothetical protein